MLTRLSLSTGLSLTRARGAGGAFDFYVDSVSGSDTNDGKTSDTAWATLGHLASLVAPAQGGDLTLSATTGTVDATKSSGTFTTDDLGFRLADGDGDGYGEIIAVDGTATCTLRIDSEFASTSPGQFVNHRFGPQTYKIRVRGDFTDDPMQATRDTIPGAHLKLTFDEASTVKQSAGNTDSMSGFSSGGITWALEILGEGNLTIQDFVNGTANGVGANNTTTVIVRDTTITSCGDGLSAHGDAVLKSYNCDISDCNKGGIVDANSSTSEHYGTTVTEKAGGSSAGLLLFAGAGSVLEDCILIPDSAGSSVNLMGGAVCERTRFGTLTTRVNIKSGTKSTLTDCYLNATIAGGEAVTLDGCYGKLTSRARDGGDIDISHCVLVGGASGQTNTLLFRNFDFGSHGGFNVIDSVLTGFGTAIGDSFGETDAGYFEAAGNTVTYTNFFDNTTNVDADIEATSADVSTGVITTDPQIGPANTYDKADYAIAAGSPCVGAGSDGGDIGFQAS